MPMLFSASQAKHQALSMKVFLKEISQLKVVIVFHA
jgi:hypothetical protein